MNKKLAFFICLVYDKYTKAEGVRQIEAGQADSVA